MVFVPDRAGAIGASKASCRERDQLRASGLMDEYDCVFEVMTNTVESLGKEGLSKQDILPALVDFVTAFGLIIGKEPDARAIIARIEGRIEDWKAGRFPAPVRETSMPQGRRRARRRFVFAPDLCTGKALVDQGLFS